MFQKQAVMRRVVYSMIPLFLFAIYKYGPRVVLVVATVFIFGILTEYFVEKARNKKVSEAVLVTCAIFALALPPAVPLWVAVVGIVFAVLLGKGVYGGFGRNIFNPAITGRIFIWISFPAIMMTEWLEPSFFGTDAVSSATPLAMLRDGETLELAELFLGWHASSMGESSILLILIAAAYLVWTKSANWRLMVSTFGTAAILTVIFHQTGLDTEYAPQYALMSGSLVYVSVFMSTDPVSAPNKALSMWIYGFIIGGMTALVRSFADFPEGTSFGLLLGNTFACLLDEIVIGLEKRKKARAAQSTAATASG